MTRPNSKSTVVSMYYQHPPDFNLIKTDNWFATCTVTLFFSQERKRDKFMYNSLVHTTTIHKDLKSIRVQLANMCIVSNEVKSL